MGGRVAFDPIHFRPGAQRRPVNAKTGLNGLPLIPPFTDGEPMVGPLEIAHFSTLHALGALNVS